MSSSLPCLIRSGAEARAVTDMLKARRYRFKRPVLAVIEEEAPVDERLFQLCDGVLDILSAFFN